VPRAWQTLGMMNVDVGEALHASCVGGNAKTSNLLHGMTPDAFCENSSSTREPKHELSASYDDSSVSKITATAFRSYTYTLHRRLDP
jgi:hypothetical protein